MRSTADQLQPGPRLVAAVDADAARGGAAGVGGGTPFGKPHADIADKLLNAMQVVKRARFNAHERLEAKHTASVAAFTLATVVEIAISLAGIVFAAQLPADVAAFLNFAAIVTAVFLFGFGMVVGLANYQTRALYLQRCAQDLGNLADEMRISLPVATAELQEFRRRYHEIVSRCPANHEPVDLERALAKPSDAAATRQALWGQWLDVYGPYVLASAGYVTVWVTFLMLLRA